MIRPTYAPPRNHLRDAMQGWPRNDGMTDREAAWDAVHEALPAGWTVGPPMYNPGVGGWSVTARSTTYRGPWRVARGDLHTIRGWALVVSDHPQRLWHETAAGVVRCAHQGCDAKTSQHDAAQSIADDEVATDMRIGIICPMVTPESASPTLREALTDFFNRAEAPLPRPSPSRTKSSSFSKTA